jgi:hypothetical protein
MRIWQWARSGRRPLDQGSTRIEYRLRRLGSAGSDEKGGDGRGGTEILMLFRGVVVQVLPEPSLNFSYAQSLAFAVVGHLVAVNLAEAEIARFRMGEV